ncbi:hypothetical protein [Adlercreutzia sp. ZJ138]|uniref:hypothetical protein n=1 Tax=Adlercreutzia sp. ZJ138 TaxID=2709405 RepID=UPI0013ED741D|nr:hypothetical protein [Adlercreutzia sp. ZJ138]
MKNFTITNEYILDIARKITYLVVDCSDGDDYCPIYVFPRGSHKTLVIDAESGEWQLAGDNDIYRSETDIDIDLDEAIELANECVVDKNSFMYGLACALRFEFKNLKVM